MTLESDPARTLSSMPSVSARAAALREALVALDSLTRLTGHLWHDVDLPLHLVAALRADLAHLGLHLRRAAGLAPVPQTDPGGSRAPRALSAAPEFGE